VTHHRPQAQDTTAPLRHLARCPRCLEVKHLGDLMCTSCYRQEPWSCRRCGSIDYLLGGLCPECTVDDAAAGSIDVDAPIPFSLTAQAEAELARDRRERALFDSNIPEGWWEPEGAW